jgi:mono/diheme cytochrome c family protein
MKRFLPAAVVLAFAVLWHVRVRADQPSAADVEFFEKKVRPLLHTHCASCHANGKSKGGLSLASRDTMLKGGESGAVVMAGQPDKSLLVEAINYKGDLKMPPKGKLSEAEIADLTDWVKRGLPWPATVVSGDAGLRSGNDAITAEERAFWSFQPVADPPPPAVKDEKWAKGPIDRFILAKLEEKGLHPVAPAGKRALIRRATFDLTGLPPTSEEIDAFLADDSPDAFAKVVERLLTSPHYGERWGRHWLDVARYGEDQAHTFQARVFPNGYRYRDWVVKAFNDDMPYHRFVTLQIAGDLVKEGDPTERLPALGYFATGPHYYSDGGAGEVAELDDRVDTLTRGFLGLTAACARCHDHKYDPIPTKDYYSLAGIFRSSRYVEQPLGPPEVVERYNEAQDRVRRQDAKIKQFLDEQAVVLAEKQSGEAARYMTAAWKLQNKRKTTPNLTVAEVAKQDKLTEVVLDRWVTYLSAKASETRPSLAGWRQALAELDASKDLSADADALAKVEAAARAYQDELQAALRERDELTQRKEALEKDKAAWLKEIFSPQQGVFRVDAKQVEGRLSATSKAALKDLRTELDGFKKSVANVPLVHTLTDGSVADMRIYVRGDRFKEGDVAPRRFLRVLAGDDAPPFTEGSGRLELARAIASKDNPLTARVMVNRIWQHHFGRGLVATSSNFGKLGQRPTHPELLDHLATQFVSSGWSVKAMHRAIMLSATYQSSCDRDERAEQVDPGNQLLWRMSRQRLDVESWRDALLAASGTLDPTVGGPSQDLNATGNHRRTLYGAVSRHNLNNLLRLFDFPDPNITSESRPITTVALQQLFVLNSDFMVEQARALAKRLESADPEDAGRIRKAYPLLYGRLATEREVQLGLEFLTAPEDDSSKAVLSRWEQYAQVLLGANEFIYVD